ncbi:uncharacterized protein PG986_011645 [Apiospora aurea]|uniref:Uncharacterized protein n=1 Tax=Apiospora aurea TaxID=335848 RepID=A0ABR1PYB5_9PEZI
MAPPMILTLDSAKARRQDTLDAAKQEYTRRGIAAEWTAQVGLKDLVTRAEADVFAWLLNLADTDDRRALALTGCILKDYVAWQVDALIWDMLHFGQGFDMGNVRAEFTKKHPVPNQEKNIFKPTTSWASDVVKATQAAKETAIEALKADEARLEADLRAKQAEIAQAKEELEKGPASWFSSL